MLPFFKRLCCWIKGLISMYSGSYDEYSQAASERNPLGGWLRGWLWQCVEGNLHQIQTSRFLASLNTCVHVELAIHMLHMIFHGVD